MTLSQLLAIPRGITALTGGGGKTTAMYVLARELRTHGTVICTTTTRIFPPSHLPVLDGDDVAALAAALAEHGCVCAGAPAEQGKLSAPALGMERLAGLADWVLVEADGSKGLPVKAHLAHEPVIPPQTGRTVVLVGASAFGRPIREAVHRPERFCVLTGSAPEEPVTPGAVAALLAAEGLGDCVFVNQAETQAARAACGVLAELSPRPVFAGSLQGGIWKCLSSFAEGEIWPPARLCGCTARDWQ